MTLESPLVLEMYKRPLELSNFMPLELAINLFWRGIDFPSLTIILLHVHAPTIRDYHSIPKEELVHKIRKGIRSHMGNHNYMGKGNNRDEDTSNDDDMRTDSTGNNGEQHKRIEKITLTSDLKPA
jgi:hypothetical protein